MSTLKSYNKKVFNYMFFYYFFYRDNLRAEMKRLKEALKVSKAETNSTEKKWYRKRN